MTDSTGRGGGRENRDKRGRGEGGRDPEDEGGGDIRLSRALIHRGREQTFGNGEFVNPRSARGRRGGGGGGEKGVGEERKFNYRFCCETETRRQGGDTFALN